MLAELGDAGWRGVATMARREGEDLVLEPPGPATSALHDTVLGHLRPPLPTTLLVVHDALFAELGRNQVAINQPPLLPHLFAELANDICADLLATLRRRYGPALARRVSARTLGAIPARKTLVQATHEVAIDRAFEHWPSAKWARASLPDSGEMLRLAPLDPTFAACARSLEGEAGDWVRAWCQLD